MLRRCVVRTSCKLCQPDSDHGALDADGNFDHWGVRNEETLQKGKKERQTSQSWGLRATLDGGQKIGTSLEFLMKLALVQLATRGQCIPDGLPEIALSKAPNLDTLSGHQLYSNKLRNEDLDVL